MMTLNFADTHNMVAFLSKLAESDGFEQIVDFLNVQLIKYALTVNLTIYISCIEQFWSTGMVKTINGEVQLHALVDGKKIITFKASVRRDLKLEDKEVQRLLHGMSLVALWHLLLLAQALEALKTSKPKEKGKGIMIEEPVKPMKKKDLIRLDEKVALKLRAKFDEEERLATLFPTMVVPQPSDPSDNVADKAVHKELGDSLVRAATTASSLEAEQDSGNITKTQSKATPNESSSIGTTSGGGPRCQETMRDTIAQTRFENVSKLSNDPLLARGNTLQSDEDRLKLNELMELCTNLQKKVLDLEKTKTTQANEIASLKRRVKKLKKKRSSRTHKLKRLYKVGLSTRVESSGDEEDLEVVDAAQVSTAATTVTITTEAITLAQALEALKTSKPKVKGIVFQEPGESITTKSTIISSQQSQDKGKGIMIKEPMKPIKTRDLIRLDEEVALKLQAEFD
ncbi:hypothetical protein Tco_0370482 [Tanacetum coccineum]